MASYPPQASSPLVGTELLTILASGPTSKPSAGTEIASAQQIANTANALKNVTTIGINTSTPIASLDIESAVNGGINLIESITGPGKVSNSAGSGTVTGVGTTFQSTFSVGDSIVIPTAAGNGVSTQQSVTIGGIVSNVLMTTSVITASNTAVAYDPIAFTAVSVNQSTPMYIQGTTNKFLQHQIVNLSNGGNAQAGYTATSDVGTDISGFVGMYINCSGYTNAANSIYNIGAAGDSALTALTAGKNFYIGNLDTTGGVTYGFNGGNTSANVKMTINNYGVVACGTYSLLGVLKSVNMNTTSDQAITITLPGGATKYAVMDIMTTNPSISLTTAQGGIYTGASKSGSTLVAASQAYTVLTAATSRLDLTLAGAVSTSTFTASSLYVSLTTGQGAPSTLDYYVYGIPLP